MYEINIWLNEIDKNTELKIYIREEFKTTLRLANESGAYDFESLSDEICLKFSIDKELSWINFATVSYLWCEIISEHSETIQKIRLEDDRVIITGCSNTYVLEKQD